MPETIKGQVTLYDAAGQPFVKDLPAQPLTTEEARVMRDFKKILQRYSLQHNFRCAKCEKNRAGLPGYLDWTIGPNKIVLMCGCRQIVYLGATL
jgi:hypothetical protein